MNQHKLVYFIIVALLCPLILLADNYVIINQVSYDTSLSEDAAPAHNGEFVELYNAGMDEVNLEGWQLKGGMSSEVWTFTSANIIPSGGYLLVACRRGATNQFQLSDWYTGAFNKPVVYQNKIILANTGEIVTLCNAANDTIDQMYYDGTSHKTNPDRLYAENENNLAGDSCVSLHRTWVEFDADGKVVPGTSQWQTATVSFSENMLPHNSYHEDYLLGEQSLPTGENYVLSVVPLDPTMRIDINDGRISVSSSVRYQAALTYLDGLDREEQTLALNASPCKQDIVSAVEYTGKRKVFRQWLPIAMNTEGQRTPLSELTAQVQSDYADNRPFTEMQYEPSSLRRITKRYLPGEDYHEPHGASESYDIYNGFEPVRVYSIVNDSILETTGENYPPHSLYKTATTDEDQKSITVYTNQLGQTVMEKRADNCTYYVYDEMRRLRYVLPHAAQSKLTNGEYAPDNTTLRATAYRYRYDARGNTIYKRLPGCEPQYIVYDQAGQLVLSQNGNQRRTHTWTMYTYDALGRNTLIKEIETQDTHSDLIETFANQWQVADYGNVVRILSVNYYDNYDYLTALPAAKKDSLQFAQESGYGIPYENATGLLTGTRVYDLSDNQYTITAYYYDSKGRVVQSRSARNTGGYTITNTEYLFDGSVAKQQTEHRHGEDITREHYRYTYDHTGRPLKTLYRLNNDAEITLSSFSYDSIGRLVQNLLSDSQDTIRYSYDMRNRLKETSSKHFSERLYYADHPSEDVTPCFNGNISAIHTAWLDTVNTYAYAYDMQNRLLSSKRLTANSTSKSESFGYDAEGNISSLKRYSGNRLIDDLVFDYGNDGNQLLSVTDAGEDADLYSTIEYHNADTPVDTTMCYDANGNLIWDMDRGITAIRYNILNLPDTILFTNGNRIVNHYDAAGHKYKSIVYTVPATAVTASYDMEHAAFDPDSMEYRITEYAGNIETIYTPRDTTRRIFNTIGYRADNAYYYFIKDHLGNICAVVNATADTVVQRTMYYASGVPMAQSWGRDTQPYLYNGKEFIESHGWNTYDYGFRGYYAPTGRFTSIDPLAEQTPWQSPYAYAGNNFINNIDWMGLSGMSTSTLHWVAVDQDDNILGLDLNSPDQGVYVVDDDKWDGTYWDLLRYELIGNHVGLGAGWGIGMNIRGRYDKSGGGYYNTAWGRNVAYGTTPRKDANLLVDIFRTEPSLVLIAMMSLSEDIASGLFKGILWDSHFTYNKQALQLLSRTDRLGVFIIKNAPTIISAGMIGYNMYTEGFTPNNIGNAVVTALTTYLTNVAMESGITGVATTIGTGATFALGAGVIAAEVYSAWYGLTTITNAINTQCGNYDFFGDLYLNGSSWGN